MKQDQVYMLSTKQQKQTSELCSVKKSHHICPYQTTYKLYILTNIAVIGQYQLIIKELMDTGFSGPRPIFRGKTAPISIHRV